MREKDLFHVRNWCFWQAYLRRALKAGGHEERKYRRWCKQAEQRSLQIAFNKNEEASVTVFTALALVGILTLFTVLLPASQLRLLESRLPDLVNLQLQQILASYHRPLLDRYGLTAYPESALNTKQLERMLDKDYDNYAFVSAVSPQEPLLTSKFLEREVLHYMRPRAPLGAFLLIKKRFSQFYEAMKSQAAKAQELLNIGETAEAAKAALKRLQAFAGEAEEQKIDQELFERSNNVAPDLLMPEYGEGITAVGDITSLGYIAPLTGIKPLKYSHFTEAADYLQNGNMRMFGTVTSRYLQKSGDTVGDFIKNKLRELVAKGVLKALEKFSDGYAQLETLAENNLSGGQGVTNFAVLFNTLHGLYDKLQNSGVMPIDNLLLNEYIISFCSSSVRNGTRSIPADNKISNNLSWRGKSFQSLTYSSPDEAEECAALLGASHARLQIHTQVFLLRFGVRFFALRADKVLCATYRVFANLLAALLHLFALPLPPDAIFNCFLIIDAGIRAFGDLQVLLSGKSMRLLPTELTNVPRSIAAFEHDYLDYLRLFLLFGEREYKLQRLAMIIAANVKERALYSAVKMRVGYNGSQRFGRPRAYETTLTYKQLQMTGGV